MTILSDVSTMIYRVKLTCAETKNESIDVANNHFTHVNAQLLSLISLIIYNKKI